MENQTSFDLNAAIQRWRAGLAESSSFSKDDLDELESHVRDSVELLRTPSLSEEEAFLIAIRRTGPQEQLATEFATVNGGSVWWNRLLWMTIGWLGVPTVLSLGILFGRAESFPRGIPYLGLASALVPLAIVPLLLVIALRSSLLSKRLHAGLALTAGLLFLGLKVGETSSFVAPVMPPIALLLALIIGLRYSRLTKSRKVVVGLAGVFIVLMLYGLLVRISGPRFYSPLDFDTGELSLSCLIGASLIVRVALERLRAVTA
jgi:hypothetical protein